MVRKALRVEIGHRILNKVLKTKKSHLEFLPSGFSIGGRNRVAYRHYILCLPEFVSNCYCVKRTVFTIFFKPHLQRQIYM